MRERDDTRKRIIKSQSERWWILKRNYNWVMSAVTCRYCGEEGTVGGTNYVRLDSVHNMDCGGYSLKKEWPNKQVRIGRKSKMEYTECRKKWVLPQKNKVEKVVCRDCDEQERRKKAVQPREIRAQQMKGKKERVLRHTLQPLNEVWLMIEMEKIDTHEEVTMKALLDSRATGMFVDRKFMEKNGFKLEKLERAMKIRNMDRTKNSRGIVTHEIECNMYCKGHVERMKLDICDLGKTKVILGMPWLVAHNPDVTNFIRMYLHE